jgi:hypothetical protein
LALTSEQQRTSTRFQRSTSVTRRLASPSHRCLTFHDMTTNINLKNLLKQFSFYGQVSSLPVHYWAWTFEHWDLTMQQIVSYIER